MPHKYDKTFDAMLESSARIITSTEEQRAGAMHSAFSYSACRRALHDLANAAKDAKTDN